jgi:uncharacterized protein YndB with AHSA1/START domain
MSAETVPPAPPKRTALWKKLLLLFALMIVAFVVLVALQPGEFRVSRSVTMAAPPSAPFEQVNDFHKWKDWSPWDQLDPNMKRTFDGPPAGKGATYAWAGDDKVGEGKMTILESIPGEKVVIKLEFIKPFPSESITEFAFKPEGGGTAVTWTMSGKNNFLSKAFTLFMNMDAMIGPDFEKGLASIKALVEKQ